MATRKKRRRKVKKPIMTTVEHYRIRAMHMDEELEKFFHKPKWRRKS